MAVNTWAQPPSAALQPQVSLTCKQILAKNKNSASAVYQLLAPSSKVNYEAYCEMGLNGGGYTFLSPESLTLLSNADIQSMFTDTATFLIRLRACNGTQTFAVLAQLPRNSRTPLYVGLSTNTGYNTPLNADSTYLGTPYLYFGFLPITSASSRRISQGLQVNGNQISFTNCDGNPNNYFALFPNFQERTPTSYLLNNPFALFDTNLLNSFQLNPSTRVLPEQYFLFLESHFGGCGWYSQIDSRLLSKCVLGASIGFR